MKKAGLFLVLMTAAMVVFAQDTVRVRTNSNWTPFNSYQLKNLKVDTSAWFKGNARFDDSVSFGKLVWVPSVVSSDSSNKVASTKFVKQAIKAAGTGSNGSGIHGVYGGRGIAKINDSTLKVSDSLYTEIANASAQGVANAAAITAKKNIDDTLGKAGYVTRVSRDKLKDSLDALISANTAAIAGKQNTLTLTATGSSGAATLVGATLNIPQYSGGGTTSYQSQTIVSGTSVTFTSVPASYNDYIIFRNGVRIRPIVHYTTSGNVVTIPAADPGDVIVLDVK